MLDRIHILGLTGDELRAEFARLGLPAYRAEQVRQWVFQRRVDDWAAMTNLSKADRTRLAELFVIAAGQVADHQVSSDGVHKLLIAWGSSDPAAGDTSEAVMIPSDFPADYTDYTDSGKTRKEEQSAESAESVGNPESAESVGKPRSAESAGRSRRTACISTQVGCPVGCRFCASGMGGLGRNLTAGQIVEQVWQLARVTLPEKASVAQPPPAVGSAALGPISPAEGGRITAEGGCATGGSRITNVVLMGIGEPLANYDAVVKSIRLINAPDGLDIGARKITLSTVGLPAQIRRLAGEDLQITLAISLHAPNQQLRSELIPWAARFPLDAVVAAARDYFDRTGREITLEYVLLKGVNTLAEHADQLADIAHQLRCNVNLIHYNPGSLPADYTDYTDSGKTNPVREYAESVGNPRFQRAGQATAVAFRDRLARRGVNVHIRSSRGLNIDAACGQLRRRNRTENHH